MLVDVEILPYLLNADEGCPKCQYIMADHYKHGIGVPKNKERAKHYYKLLASHNPEKLAFIGTCYGRLLLLIAYMDYNDREDEEAKKYFELATAYFKGNYPLEEAEEKINDANIEKYMTSMDVIIF